MFLRLHSSNRARYGRRSGPVANPTELAADIDGAKGANWEDFGEDDCAEEVENWEGFLEDWDTETGKEGAFALGPAGTVGGENWGVVLTALQCTSAFSAQLHRGY